MLGEVDEDLRVHQVAGELAVGDAAAHLLLDLRAGRRRGRPAGSASPGRTVSGGCPFSTFAGAPPGSRRTAGPGRPWKYSTTESGNAMSRSGSSTSSGVRSLVTMKTRQVADHLGGGRDLHDVAEHPVDLGVGAGHLAPARLDAERPRLLAQVGVLAAGHLVLVDLGGAGAHVALEARVRPRARPPSSRPTRASGSRARPVSRGDPRSASTTASEVRLRGEAAHRVHRRVGGVHAGLGRGEHGRRRRPPRCRGCGSGPGCRPPRAARSRACGRPRACRAPPCP